MNEKEKVIDWIKSGMNYNDGIDLLVELSKKVDIGFYIGRERSQASKLAYEICKAAKVADHVTWQDFIRDVMESPLMVELPVEGGINPFFRQLLNVDFDVLEYDDALTLMVGLQIEPVPESLDEIREALWIFRNNYAVADANELNELTNDGRGTKLPDAVAREEGKLRICEADAPAIVSVETIARKPLEEYPLVMRRVILEYAELFQERSQLHTVMGRLPESNAESVCAKRSELFNLIKSISDRLELLFVTQEAFAKEGTIPVEAELFPPAAEPVAEAPADTTLIDEDSLKKQKKNLQSGNSKDQTILDYQANERTEVKKPMPNGPKRTKIEMRIAERNIRIEEIEVALLKIPSK